MTALEQLKILLRQQYIAEDGKTFSYQPLPALSNEQIDALAATLPGGKIPDGIRELLQYASGIGTERMEDITFDAVGLFGLEEFFPHSVQLSGDGLGNFWVLHIDHLGQWGEVFFVCHDPAVIVKQSDDLSQYLYHLDEFGKAGEQSQMYMVQERLIWEVWKQSHLISLEQAIASHDLTLQQFATTLPPGYVIGDLRNKLIGSGIAWGKSGARMDKNIKHPTELLWGIERPVKRGFFAGCLVAKWPPLFFTPTEASN